jgi:hypothetical protein
MPRRLALSYFVSEQNLSCSIGGFGGLGIVESAVLRCLYRRILIAWSMLQH